MPRVMASPRPVQLQPALRTKGLGLRACTGFRFSFVLKRLGPGIDGIEDLGVEGLRI